MESRVQEYFVNEIWILGFEVQVHLKESGTPPIFEIYMQVPLTKNPESIAWNPESKTVWGSLIWCKKFIQMTSGYFPRWQTTHCALSGPPHSPRWHVRQLFHLGGISLALFSLWAFY